MDDESENNTENDLEDYVILEEDTYKPDITEEEEEENYENTTQMVSNLSVIKSGTIRAKCKNKILFGLFLYSIKFF